MKRTIITAACLWLLIASSLAQSAPLKAEISVFNGASNLSMANTDMPEDSSIRLVLTLTNQTPDKVEVTSIQCQFFDGDGRALARDHADPLQLRAREQKTAILFYPNPAGLYAFRATGTIECVQDGQRYSLPFHIDQSDTGPPSGPGLYR